MIQRFSKLSRGGKIPNASESKPKLPVNLAYNWQAAQRAWKLVLPFSLNMSTSSKIKDLKMKKIDIKKQWPEKVFSHL